MTARLLLIILYVLVQNNLFSQVDTDLGDSLRNSANKIRRQGDYDQALKLYEQALEEYNKLNYPLGIAKTYNSMGSLYRGKGDIELAEDYLFKAISINTSNGYTEELLKNYNGLGNVFDYQNRKEEALKYFQKIIDVLNEKPPELPESSVFRFRTAAENGLGLVCLSISETDKTYLDSAYTHFKTAETYYEKMGNEHMFFLVKKNIGFIHENKNELDQALSYYNGLLGYAQNEDMEAEIAEVTFNIANVYFQKKNYKRALDNYRDAKRHFKSLGNRVMEKNVFQRLAEYFIVKNQLDSSLYYFERYRNLNDSIYNEGLANSIAEQEEKFENASLELENHRIRLKNQDVQLNNSRLVNIVLIISLVLFVLLVLFFVARYKQWQSKRAIDDMLTKQEINSLQGVLSGKEEERQRIATDLHDKLGATLGMVKLHFSAVEDRIDTLRDDNRRQYEKANQLLDQASSEVRNISHDLLSVVLVKFGLVAALHDLKETVESAGKLQIQLITGSQEEMGLTNNQELQIYRMVQELVSNILKHARASEAAIQLNRTNGKVNLIVEDNGIGFAVSVVKTKRGMGLKNLEARAAGMDASIHFDSGKGGGTTVSVDIPIKKEVL